MFLIIKLLLIGISFLQSDASRYDQYFTNNTFRFDYYHSGDTDNEQISLDQMLVEQKWAGSKTNLIDTNKLGLYKFLIIDTASGQTIYSQGFASIFGEWQTTGEAKRIWRTFRESARFPEPKRPFEFVLAKRSDEGHYNKIYSTVVDPASRFVQRPILREDKSTSIDLNGDPNQKVDILFIGVGYTKIDKFEFFYDVIMLVNALFEKEPYKSRKSDFNMRAICPESRESGISNPRKKVWKSTAISLSFNAFDSDRYVLTYDNKAVRDIASNTPYDVLVLLFNDEKYGGGGIYNLWATVAAKNSFAKYLFIHEFGHSFASLADEYYSSPVSYEDIEKPGFEPFDPNVTALLDPENLKWKEFVDPKTPVPTPWNKEAYDKMDREYQKIRAEMLAAGASEASMDSLYREIQRKSSEFLKKTKYYGKTGAFEGAGYRATGYYRPEADCVMFTRNEVPFCRVCQKAIGETIDRYVK